MKKILGRILIVIPAIALQVFWYSVLFGFLDELFDQQLWTLMNGLFSVMAVIFVTALVAKRDESSYKLIWVIVILAMPIMGAFLYFVLGNKNTGKRIEKKIAQSANVLPVLADTHSEELLSQMEKDDLRMGQTFAHVAHSTGFPVTEIANTKYYPFGEDMFADMCLDLRNAQKYIYIEYFIIQPGKFWDTLTDILAERVAAGVDVRVMYDDLGSIGTYSVANVAQLSAKGIKCMPFNPFLFIKPQLNNRDHRKIMVIDGEIAYSGGVNLADEYINEVQKFGRWKDIGFRITGKAVASYTYMFAEFWNTFSKNKIPSDNIVLAEKKQAGEGYVLSYYDSPVRCEHTSNEMFIEMLSMATNYIWFYTPYLILGDALFDAFIRSARRGIDVRIIMPGVPDKKIIYRLSRSYYKDLLEAGVKIYEYQPGFVHAKGFVEDDRIAGIGTVNLDYRSLFLHYECNSLFYKADIVADVKKDYLDTLKECTQRTVADMRKGALHRLMDNFLRLIAPLM